MYNNEYCNFILFYYIPNLNQLNLSFKSSDLKFKIIYIYQYTIDILSNIQTVYT